MNRQTSRMGIGNCFEVLGLVLLLAMTSGCGTPANRRGVGAQLPHALVTVGPSGANWKPTALDAEGRPRGGAPAALGTILDAKKDRNIPLLLSGKNGAAVSNDGFFKQYAGNADDGVNACWDAGITYMGFGDGVLTSFIGQAVSYDTPWGEPYLAARKLYWHHMGGDGTRQSADGERYFFGFIPTSKYLPRIEYVTGSSKGKALDGESRIWNVTWDVFPRAQ